MTRTEKIEEAARWVSRCLRTGEEVTLGAYEALNVALALPDEPDAVREAREACVNICRNIAQSGLMAHGSPVQRERALDGVHEVGCDLISAEAALEEGGR